MTPRKKMAKDPGSFRSMNAVAKEERGKHR
jgi:hypothetical protein